LNARSNAAADERGPPLLAGHFPPRSLRLLGVRVVRREMTPYALASEGETRSEAVPRAGLVDAWPRLIIHVMWLSVHYALPLGAGVLEVSGRRWPVLWAWVTGAGTASPSRVGGGASRRSEANPTR
jgi:hypothetical protein